jgi:hypothetical protein
VEHEINAIATSFPPPLCCYPCFLQYVFHAKALLHLSPHIGFLKCCFYLCGIPHIHSHSNCLPYIVLFSQLFLRTTLVGSHLGIYSRVHIVFETPFMVGANQPVHWFFGGKGLGIQQGTSVWIGSPKSTFHILK